MEGPLGVIEIGRLEIGLDPVGGGDITKTPLAIQGFNPGIGFGVAGEGEVASRAGDSRGAGSLSETVENLRILPIADSSGTVLRS